MIRRARPTTPPYDDRVKPVILVGVLGGLVALRPAPAGACGVPDLGDAMAEVAESLAGKTEAVSTPVVVLGGGASSEGSAQSVAIGWAWGERQVGGLFPGSSITRVLVDVTHADQSSVAVTYGWYDNSLLSAGFDAGVRADASGAGPTARLTLGVRGVGVRLTGGLDVGSDTRLVGAAELVVEVLDLTGRI